ncbi:PAAR domain-containing protein [Pseudomonas sp. KFB-139]|uniref:PAAR domain-containing protein n=1 Tax=Pseudomonas serbiensis TaxID=3064350 RepID=A0ABT9CUM2_9PSED|nr:PAAR domain-containing protein [Pseudomonas sp. KFB-138]MDO7929187.1 PAAR domain-containing protein [Pseudomonas sp. KFB-138]
MGRKMIGVGAPTSTGGAVLEGNVGINIDSAVNTSSVGHMASCPVCSPGKGPIVAVGPRTIILPAGPVALEGDYVACGCPPESNTVIFGQSTVFGGAEHTNASFVSIAAVGKVKSIKEIYFSYGSSHEPLADVSRFYVDLNVHVKTSGYEVGEVIDIKVGGGIERAFSATVGAGGVAVVSGVLMDDRIDMEGEV